ncbi:hypothetical protein Lser_V15G24466 [Lactuca serriola]
MPRLFGHKVSRVLGGGLVPGSLILIGGDPVRSHYSRRERYR